MDVSIRNGNVLDELKKIPDETVDCVISSPPYYGLRDYSGVASYSGENKDELVKIANNELQKHRKKVVDHQKDRYYLTDPMFDKKDKKWHISLKYDLSEIWGGDPECEHEWVVGGHKYRSGGIQSATTGNDKIGASHMNYYSHICSKCGAWKGQIGLEPSYKMYVEHLMLVIKELKRVLKKTGSVWWNMGDSYASSGGPSRHMGYSDPKWNKARNGSFEEPTSFDQGIKPKSLMGIPELFMRATLDDGWVLRNKLPWIKMNAIPSSKQDGFTPKWEYVYFLTKKSKLYYFDLDSIRKPLAESSIKRISQKNIPNQFKSGKSTDFAETNPVNNIPKILNNMHNKYNGIYSDLTPEESEMYGSPRARNMRRNTGANTGVNNKEPYKQNNPHLMRLTANKQFFNEKGQGGNVDYNGIDSENGSHYHPNGANPGDILFDDTIYDLYSDPNIQDAFIEYLERERPELLMPSVLDIPIMPHSFAHFAVFPETLVDPLMKAGCPSEVCIKCGKPKRPFFTDTGRYYVHDRNGEYVDEKYLEYHPKDGKTKIADATNVSISSVFNTNPIKERVTNWIPSCNCNAGFKPGVVLDPFAGSGTVGIVAKKQGKSAILIEINPEYLQIIKDRLEITGEGTKIDVNFVEVASPDNWEEDE